jgi:MFS family permease
VLILATFLPSFYQQGLGLSAAESGLALGPIIASTAIGNIMGGQVSLRVKSYRRFAEYGLLVGIAACFAAMFLSQLKVLWIIEVAIFVMTVGVGIALPITMISMQNGVDRADMGVATSTTNFLRQFMGALLIAAVGFAINRLLPIGILSSEVIFASAGVSALISYVFLLRMEERPLRG